MKWKEINIKTEKNETEPFVAIGKGKIKVSKGACSLIDNFDKCTFVTFMRAKKDRIYFVGLKFSETPNPNAYVFLRPESKIFGAVIVARDLIRTLYGKEGVADKYTKHSITMDRDKPNMLVIYYNYKNHYYLDNDASRPVRTRHIGSIVNDEWLVVSSSPKDENGKKSPTYLLRNINNGEEIRISTRALADINRGLTTVENIKLCRKIGINSYRGIRRAEKKERIKLLKNN